MRSIYAYDFDKTIVPYDSFRQYLLLLLREKPICIGCLLVLRRCRLISSVEMKEYITKIVDHSESLINKTKCFAQRVTRDITWTQVAPADAIKLIISASPKVYMRYIADILQCELICSDTINETYIEMYGDVKASYLHQLYPPTEYVYTYAASDSNADLCWMKDFNQYEKVNKQ